MKSFLFIIFSIVILSGCVQKQYAKIDTPTDNSTVVIEDHSWEPDQKNYWITLYFARMSYDPSVRMKYPPENLYNLCKCIIDIMENWPPILFPVPEFICDNTDNDTLFEENIWLFKDTKNNE